MDHKVYIWDVSHEILDQLYILVGNSTLEVKNIIANWHILAMEYSINAIVIEAGRFILHHFEKHAKYVIEQRTLLAMRAAKAEQCWSFSLELRVGNV